MFFSIIPHFPEKIHAKNARKIYNLLHRAAGCAADCEAPFFSDSGNLFQNPRKFLHELRYGSFFLCLQIIILMLI